MRSFTVKLFAYAVFAGFLFSGCAGTKLTDTWVDSAYQGKPVSNILVIGLTFEGNEKVRQDFENSFVSHLKKTGIEAISSMNTVPSPSDMKLKKEDILNAVKKYNNDAVIITHLVGTETKYTDTYQNPVHSAGNFYLFYGGAYDAKGYSRSSKTVYLETNLYDVKTEKLIWSGRSKTFEPDADRQIYDDVVSKVIEELKKNNLIL